MKTNFYFNTIISSILAALFVVCGNVSAQGSYGYILSGSSGYNITQLDLTTKTIGNSVNYSDYSYAGTLNQRGTKLWVIAYSSLNIINTATRNVISQQSLSSSSYYFSRKPLFSPDGSKAYMLSGSNPIYVDERDTATYLVKTSHQVQNSYYPRSAPVLSRDGKKLYFIDDNSYLHEVNTVNWTSKRTSISASYSKVKLSPNDTLIFVYGSSYSSIQVYKTSTLTSAGTIQTNNSYVSALEFSRDGNTLFVGFESAYYMQIFDLSLFPSVTSTFATLPSYSYDLALDPNSDSLLYVAHYSYFNDNVSVYNIPLGSVTKRLSSSNYSYALVMPMKVDAVPPAPVTDLQAVALNYDAVRLTFTVSGDDGTSGDATFYDVRYDTAQITDLNFRFAKKVIGTGIPKTAGSIDSVDVGGLIGETTYYFAVKIGDEVLNLSSITTTSATTPAPARIAYQLDTLTDIVKDNDSLTLNLNIQNIGDADLHYNLSLLAIAPLENEIMPISAGTSNAFNTNSPVSLSKANAAEISALILYSGSSSATYDIVQKVYAQGGFSYIEYFSASSSYPSLSYLQNFDVVFVYSNGSFYSSSLMGDLLADYVDSGGNVVTAMLANTNYYIQGRFLTENYFALLPGNYSGGTRATLGTVHYPSHPIMKGVQSFDGGYYSARPFSANIAAGAKVIASWSDGSPLIVTKPVKGKMRVDLGFYPVSSDYTSDGWVSSTDGAKIIANALKYAAASYGGVIGGEMDATFSSDSGTVGHGQSENVTVTLKTINAMPGEYIMVIGIESNDPDSSFVFAITNFSVHDVTAPKVGIRFFPNEAFTQSLGIISIAHEKLYSPVMKAGIGSDTTQAGLSLIDTTNFVYNSIYKLQGSGSYYAVLEASDSLGNHSRTVREVVAAEITPASLTKIASDDAAAKMEVPQNAVDKNLFLLVSRNEEDVTVVQNTYIGSAYSFAPQSLKLNKPALLMMKYEKPAGEEVMHYGIFTKNEDGRWVYVSTQHDAEQQTLYAYVDVLGEYRIINSPDIQTEQYVKETPSLYALQQNYPNPFNPSTTIRFMLPVNGMMSLKIYDLLGREVQTLIHEVKEASDYTVEFSAATLPSGVYFYTLKSGNYVETKKMLLLK